MFNISKNKLIPAVLLGASLSSFSLHATVVEVRTVVGDFQVNLFDEITPATVQNFLDYVNSGAYANNVVHRSEPGFVIQAGAFTYNNATPLDEVATGPSVVNEPELSNLRGTIAMAKVGNQPNSATSQWFINLDDNSANLDVQNGGFTAFGQVLGDGMQVLDAIADLPRFNLGGAATAIPLRNYTATDAANAVELTDDNFVIITDIVVVDAATVTNPNLNPARNTLINTPTTPPSNGGGSSGGGALTGAPGIGLMTLLLFAICMRRKPQITG